MSQVTSLSRNINESNSLKIYINTFPKNYLLLKIHFRTDYDHRDEYVPLVV